MAVRWRVEGTEGSPSGRSAGPAGQASTIDYSTVRRDQGTWHRRQVVGGVHFADAFAELHALEPPQADISGKGTITACEAVRREHRVTRLDEFTTLLHTISAISSATHPLWVGINTPFGGLTLSIAAWLQTRQWQLRTRFSLPISQAVTTEPRRRCGRGLLYRWWKRSPDLARTSRVVLPLPTREPTRGLETTLELHRENRLRLLPQSCRDRRDDRTVLESGQVLDVVERAPG